MLAIGLAKLRTAIEEAMELGCTDSVAVRYLVTAHDLKQVRPPVLEVGELAQFERPFPDVAATTDFLKCERHDDRPYGCADKHDLGVLQAVAAAGDQESVRAPGAAGIAGARGLRGG